MKSSDIRTIKVKSVESALGIRTTEEVARRIDQELKENKNLKPRTKAATSSTTEVTKGERTDVSVICTGALDRDGEIVIPGGVQMEDFLKNPVVRFSHDWDRPIAKSLWTKYQAAEDRILAKTYYAARQPSIQGEWFPDYVWGMVAEEVLKGKSISYLPIVERQPTREEKQLNPGLNCVVESCILLEYSIVSIPANPEALLQAVQKGFDLGITKIGHIKKKQPDYSQRIAAELKRWEMDSDRMAEEAVKTILKRWEI